MNLFSRKNPPTPGKTGSKILPYLAVGILTAVIAFSIAYSLPIVLALITEHEQNAVISRLTAQFPVTVDPLHKTIVENADVESYLTSPNSPLEASANGASNILKTILYKIANLIASIPWYHSLAGADGQFVTITPGMRKEQVTIAFADALDWTKKDKTAFVTPVGGSTLPLTEGSFSPATYFVTSGETGTDTQAIVNARFTEDVLSHYGTTTAAAVPLEQALNVASLVQRETLRPEDMRLVSGIIWNRIFANMDLQIDSTLQYAKASKTTTGSWWPKVVPNDKYVKSPYNTYTHPGLPPTPIANPSVAAILAALNPIKTPCLYYFNDRDGVFHCSQTYPEHVALLKKYYGQGK